jgi:hypothetical protein
MKCMKKYADGGMTGGPSNRDMRDLDRASRESYRMARPERRLARNREDVGRLLADLEGYDPHSQINRNIARKIAALGTVGSAIPAAITLKEGLKQARRDAWRGRDTSNEEYDYWGTSTKELSDLQKLLLDMFGIGRQQ